MRLLPILAAIALFGVVTGCGSSRPRGVNFRSANQHYTVKQVEEAFAAQGFGLIRPARQEIPGFVALRCGHKPDLLVVLVEVSPRKAGTVYLDLGKDSGKYSKQSHGNVSVAFAESEAQPVRNALARLH